MDVLVWKVENIVAVAESVLERSSTSTRHFSEQLNISPTFWLSILHIDLGMKLVQELTPLDHPMHVCCAEWTKGGLVEGDNFY